MTGRRTVLGMVACRDCKIERPRHRGERPGTFVDNAGRHWSGLVCPLCRGKRQGVKNPGCGRGTPSGLNAKVGPSIECSRCHRLSSRWRTGECRIRGRSGTGTLRVQQVYRTSAGLEWRGLVCPTCLAEDRRARKRRARAVKRAAAAGLPPPPKAPPIRFPTPEERAARRIIINGVAL